MNHKTKKIKLGRKKREIDKKIIPLVKILNKFGIETLYSCQGEKRGYISLNPKNVEIYHGIVNGKKEFNVMLRFPAPK